MPRRLLGLAFCQVPSVRLAKRAWFCLVARAGENCPLSDELWKVGRRAQRLG
jgi:hypothetical protein